MNHPSPKPTPLGAASRSAVVALLASALLLGACAPLAPSPGGGVAAGASSAAPAKPPVRLRLIAFNDFHGNLEATAGLTLPWPDPAAPGKAARLHAGGAAHLAGLVKALRADVGPGNSLVISSGDLVGGTPLVSALFHHEPTVEVMNLLGLDLAIPGNHEFDAGQAELLRLMRGGCRSNAPGANLVSCALGPYAGAAYPQFVANVVGANGQPLLAPSVVRQVQGVRVGFIGAVTKVTPTIVVPSGVAGLHFGDEATAINAEAARLKAQGVHALVAVIHEGGDTGTPGLPLEWNDVGCPNPRGAIFDIAKKLTPDIGVIFSGHTHQGYRCVVDGRPIMQATALGRGVSVADLEIDASTGRIARDRTVHRNLPVFNERSEPGLRQAIITAEPAPFAQVLARAVPDAAVAQRVAAYLAAAAPLAQRTVGRISGNFERNAKTDASAGRLVADAQWLATRDSANGGAQFALMNPGGVRSDLRCPAAPPCDVNFNDVFTMQPFGNNLMVMSLSGAQVKQMLEDQQRPGRSAPLFLIPSANLTYRWLAQAPHGQRVQDLRLNGQPLVPSDEHRLTVNSFLADGGDGVVMLKEGRQRLGGELDLDALTRHLQSNPSPDPKPRITLVE